MATIDIRRNHSLSAEEARKRAEDLAKTMQEKFDIEWHWEGERIVFDAPRGGAKGTKGSVDVSAAEVRVQIDLPFLLRPMKGMVESRVNERLSQIL